MVQSDARFGYRAKLSRTDHDLSQPFGFTCAPGQLLPIWFDYATPGDTYYINHDLSFLRTAPLAAPAMVDVIVHYESFFVPMQLLYQPFENSVFSIKPIYSSMFSAVSMQNMVLPVVKWQDIYDGRSQQLNKKGDTVRLLDMLQTCPNSSRTSQVSSFPMSLLAYQCVYQYYYRLDDKEDFSNKGFNWDEFYADSSVVAPYISSKLDELHLRPWRFDYYTSSYRSPIVSAANTQRVLPNRQFSNIVPVSTVAISDAGTGTNDNNEVRAFSSLTGDSYSKTDLRLQISTAAVRQMFANEKLAMITGRTRKNYDSQVLAHYGVDVPHDVKHDISLIGKDSFKLRIGEVTSLASTEASPLGELAGKGWAYGEGERHKFTAPCHGVVITIFSVEPMKRYEDGFNRLNAITNVIDLPTPEYDRLGNMPMFNYETDFRTSLPAVDPFGIAAWKERYYYSKRRMPRVSRAFMHTGRIAQPGTNTNNYSSYFICSAPFAWQSVNDISHPEAADAYYIQPNCMDDLMLVPYLSLWQNGNTEAQGQTGENWDENPFLQFVRDPFIVDSYVKVKKVSWMSKDGEPIYD